MMIMFWSVFFFLLALGWRACRAISLLLDNNNKKIKKKLALPPGPCALPVIGNLHQLVGELPHQDLHKLSNKYGPIMHLRLGSIPAIVVSSPQAAEQFLKAHDLSIASRPSIAAGEYLTYGSTGLSFAPYGPYWRNMRKLCTMHLLSQPKIDSFKSMRRQELTLLVQSIRDHPSNTPVDLTAKALSLTADMMCRMMFSRTFTDHKEEGLFRGSIQEVMKLAAAFNMADYIPYAGLVDLQGFNARMKSVSKLLDAFFDKIIDEHVTKKSSDHQDDDDFIDAMLSFTEANDMDFRIDRTNIKAVMLDMLAGGMDASAIAIEWIFSELLRNPSVMKKVEEELDTVVGKERFVEESDLVHLVYLDMVVKETMRLHPVAPVAQHHEAMQDCEVNGYHIPRKARIITNIWAIGRDPTAWVDADKFYPERFIGTAIDLRGHNFQLIPFGAGRRGCPGIQLALTVVRFAVAQLVHCFHWELPPGTTPSNLDMREVFGLIMPRATHLLAIPTTFRLSSSHDDKKNYIANR